MEQEWFDNISEQEDNMPDIRLEKKIVREELLCLLKKLNSPYKEVLFLRYYNEMSMESIAIMLNRTPENIRQIARRGRQKLKIQLEKGEYDES